jgi:IS30 family transposase
LERATSTVSQEVARHGGRPEYRANEADQRAWDSALRPKRCLLAIHVKLRKVVASKLILDWSPQQISGWLKIQYSADESMRVSHETIYRSLFIQDRAVPGHWEGDLMGGTKNSHIATLVERHSRFTALVKVRSKDTAAVVAALSRQIRRLRTSLRRQASLSDVTMPNPFCE